MQNNPEALQQDKNCVTASPKIRSNKREHTPFVPFDLILISRKWQFLEGSSWLFCSQILSADYFIQGHSQMKSKGNNHKWLCEDCALISRHALATLRALCPRSAACGGLLGRPKWAADARLTHLRAFRCSLPAAQFSSLRAFRPKKKKKKILFRGLPTLKWNLHWQNMIRPHSNRWSLDSGVSII